MPTLSRLAAAVLFAVLSFWASDILRATLPESLPGHWLSPVSAAFGALFGWRMIGRRAGHGYVASFGYSLTTLALIVFWSLLVFAAAEMVERSLRKFYAGPTEALEAMMELYIVYAKYMFIDQFLMPALIGTAFCGVIVEFVAQRARGG